MVFIVQFVVIVALVVVFLVAVIGGGGLAVVGSSMRLPGWEGPPGCWAFW
jgi:hypothetical protein